MAQNPYTGPCNFSSPREVVPIARDPNLNFTSFVEACIGACYVFYGDGNPDLAGVGVMLSYVLQLFFAILYGPVLLICGNIRRLDALTKRLRDKSQPLNLWSQLWFGLAIAVACAVRQLQQPPHYETIIILALDLVNTICGLLSISAFYGDFKHRRLFLLLVISIAVLSIFASFLPFARVFRVRRFLIACETFAIVRGYPSKAPSRSRLYRLKTSLPGFVSVVILMLVLLVVWVLERRRRARSGHLGDPPRKEFGDFASWVPEAFIIAVSLVLMALSVTALVLIYELRNMLKAAYRGVSIEDVWGFGQIGAPLAWAPLFFDTVFRFLDHGE